MELVEQYLSEKILSLLDNKGLLSYDHQEEKAYLKIKNRVFDEKIPVYCHKTKSFYLQNEIRDIIDTYYQSYYELMEQTFKPKNEMNFEDVALGVAAGLTIYNMYAPAILVLRRIQHTHIYNNVIPKPMGWRLPFVKFQVNYKFVMEFGYDKDGKLAYTYDDYIFPEEVFKILNEEMKILKPYKEKVEYNNWQLNAWEHKANMFNQS